VKLCEKSRWRQWMERLRNSLSLNMEKVAIILVNYKDYVNRFLLECRDGLRAQNYDHQDYQVYIVDNASSEESRSFIAINYPEAKIIPRTDGNYSAANNAGIAQAIKNGFELFAIVNMDTRFDPNWLVELVFAVNSKPTVGIAQSKILLNPKDDLEALDPFINSVGNIMHYLGFGYTGGLGQKNSRFQEEEIKEIGGYASGCSLITKKEVLDKIGWYDEEYYMYHDDIELGWRAKLAGYRIVLAPRSIIYHKYEFSRSIRMFYYMERNRYLVMFSFYKLPTIIAILPMMIFMEAGMILYSIINRRLGVKLSTGKYFLRPACWRHIREVRRRLRTFRQKKDKEIMADFSGEILFQEVASPLLKYIANPITKAYWLLIKKIIFW